MPWSVGVGCRNYLPSPPPHTPVRRNKHDLFKSTYARHSQDFAPTSYGIIRNGLRYTPTALGSGNT